MSLSERVVAEFKKTGEYEELDAKRSEVIAMLQSEGFKVWCDWAKLTADRHRDVALKHENPLTREESRVMFLALDSFQQIPALLGEILTPQAPVHPEQAPWDVES